MNNEILNKILENQEKILENQENFERRLDDLEDKFDNTDLKTTRIETKFTNFLNVNDVSINKEGSLNDKKQTIFLESDDVGHTCMSLLHDDVRLSTLKQFLTYRLGTFELKFKNGEKWKIIK